MILRPAVFAAFLFVAALLNGQQPFRFPIDGTRTPTSGGGFGVFTNEVLGDSRYCGRHLGVDIGGGRAGAEVHPMTVGTVKMAKQIAGLGYAVIIDHTLPPGDPAGPTVSAVYYHMKAPQALLSVGSSVTTETVIGHISNIAGDYGTGPHLHFGIRSSTNQSCDLRTGRWVYPGYTNIYKDAVNCFGGKLQCDPSDPVHNTVKSEWLPPLEFISARESVIPTCPTNFFDSFSRPDGPVGNGWSNLPSNVNGNLVVRNAALSTPGAGDGSAGVFRPIDLSSPVTISATLTHGNGFGGLLNRYTTSFSFNNNAGASTGYGVAFFRGDQNFSSFVVVNGVQLAASFQFGAAITTTFTINPNGSITGSVSGGGSTFSFNGGPIAGVSPGSNLSISMGFPDGRSSVITNPTVDNLTVAYSCNSQDLLYSQTTDQSGLIMLPVNSNVYLGSFTTANRAHELDGGRVQIMVRETSGFSNCPTALYITIQDRFPYGTGNFVAATQLPVEVENFAWSTITSTLLDEGARDNARVEPNTTYYVYMHTQCSGGRAEIKSDAAGQRFFGYIQTR